MLHGAFKGRRGVLCCGKAAILGWAATPGRWANFACRPGGVHGAVPADGAPPRWQPPAEQSACPVS